MVDSWGSHLSSCVFLIVLVRCFESLESEAVGLELRDGLTPVVCVCTWDLLVMIKGVKRVLFLWSKRGAEIRFYLRIWRRKSLWFLFSEALMSFLFSSVTDVLLGRDTTLCVFVVSVIVTCSLVWNRSRTLFKWEHRVCICCFPDVSVQVFTKCWSEYKTTVKPHKLQ